MTPEPFTRRIVSEEQVLTELERLGWESLRLAQDVYPRLAHEAAAAEAAHKALRAKRFLLAKAAGPRVSSDHATAEAEADPAVAEAYEARLIATARADACREQLRSIRENQSGVRTMAASARSPFVGTGMQ